MTSLNYYLDNPTWAKFYRYSFQPPNDGTYRRWVQGSPGMMDGMPLWSNEYGHVMMKHGQNNNLAYRGNIKQFAPSVTPHLMKQVDQCSHDTLDPAGCQTSAIRQVFTADSTPPMQPGGIPSLRGVISPYSSPHPFDVSYETGFSPYEVQIPPNSNYQD